MQRFRTAERTLRPRSGTTVKRFSKKVGRSEKDLKAERNCESIGPAPETNQLMQLNDFSLDRVLNEDSRLKSINLCLNSNETGQKAVALLEKLPFEVNSVLSQLSEEGGELLDSNDIYHRFIYQKAGFECKLIFPATNAHISKYSEQQRKMITETPEMHRQVTRPFFEELRQAGQVAWIQNILDDKSEMERRLVDVKCAHEGFIILPDYKWVDESNVNGLYLLAIVRRNDLWSVRDLGSNELPLLLAIRQAIKNIFDASQPPRYKFPDGSPVLYEHLRIFFHYPPTYPHLHIHIVLAGSSAMTAGAAVGQAILLDDVIENIQNVDGEYYRSRRALTMQFGVEHELYQRLLRHK